MSRRVAQAGWITVSDGRVSVDTNSDLRAMYTAWRFSPCRQERLTVRRCNELRATIGMDAETLDAFFAQGDAQ